VKHFSLSEPGVNARNLNTWLTEQNYRENYMKPFEIAVKKGGANAIMSAFNSVGGVWAGANYAQNVTILRNEWGFRGSMITDWSTGDGNMTSKTGLPGGNDIWLNPSSMASPISTSDPTMVYLAKQSAKNVIYTYCNTYTYAKNYDHSNDTLKVTVGTLTETEDGFAWWIILLALLDVVVVGGFATLIIFAFKKPKTPKID
jgi:beta-glucosidase